MSYLPTKTFLCVSMPHPAKQYIIYVVRFVEMSSDPAH